MSAHPTSTASSPASAGSGEASFSPSQMLLAGAVVAAVFLTNLGGPRLWDRDEPRNAGCVLEMKARGDWIIPVFNGELRTHKPVLLYWLMMLTTGLFGNDEFAFRLPSALLAAGTVGCAMALGRRFFSPSTGVWAGIVLATSLLFVMAGRAATPDAALIFTTTWAITLYALQSDELLLGGPLSRQRAAAIFAALGLAVLAKGPVGIVLPLAVIGLFRQLVTTKWPALAGCTVRQRLGLVVRAMPLRSWWRTALSLRPLLGLGVLLLVAGPWYLAVGLQTQGEFWKGFFLEHNLGRAMNAMEGHQGNLLFYPLALLVGTFPWSVLAVPCGSDLVQHWRGQTGSRLGSRLGSVLAACWIGGFVGAFSLAQTKLPSYITPCYPAVALLMGAFLDRWSRGEARVSRGWLLAAAGVLSCVGLAMLIGIPLATRDRLPGEALLGLVGLVPLLGGAVVAWQVTAAHSKAAAQVLAVSAVGLVVLIFAVGAGRVDRHQENERLLAAIRAHTSQPRVAAYACLEPSWVFYGRHPVHEISAGEVRPRHSQLVPVGSQWVRKEEVTWDDVRAWGRDACVITTRDRLAEVRARLPSSFAVLATAPLFLKSAELVVLADRPQVSRIQDRAR